MTTEPTAAAPTIELDHVGPIKHLSIPIPPEGGVVVIKGRNGSGKSHAISSVESLASRDARKNLRNSDGVPSGSIEGLGVTVRLGRSNTAKGELVCDSLDGRVDPSQLVDPGIKDPLKADVKRLATLIRLAGIRVSNEQWAAALGCVAPVHEDDPVKAADSIRRSLHQDALGFERDAESSRSEANTLAKLHLDVDINAPSDAQELATALDKATAELAKAEQQHESYLEAKKRQQDAAEQIEHFEKLDTEHTESVIAEMTKEMEGHAAKRQSIIEQIETLNRSLNEIDERLETIQSRREVEEDRLHTLIARNKERETIAAIVNAELPEKVTDQQLEQLQAAKANAQRACENGEVVRRAKFAQADISKLRDRAKTAQQEAIRLRELARSTDSVLEQALIDAGFDAIKVHDGRLCVQSDRGLEPFSDLSHGERWKLALDLAAAGLPPGAVLPVCQEAFESLDPDNRAEINRLARERGLVIVTAEATDGDLRAEVLGGAQ